MAMVCAGQTPEYQGYDGGYNGRLWLFEKCSDGSKSSTGDLDELLVLEEALHPQSSNSPNRTAYDVFRGSDDGASVLLLVCASKL